MIPERLSELSEDEGFALISSLAPAVVAAAPEKTRELVALVGSLPLGLVLVGRRVRDEAETGQPELVEKAMNELRLLDEDVIVETRNESITPTTIIAWSYKALEPTVKRAFRQTAAFPPNPSSFSFAAADSVIDGGSDAVNLLVNRGLVEFAGIGRYSVHQMISEYSARIGIDHAEDLRQTRERHWAYFTHALDQSSVTETDTPQFAYALRNPTDLTAQTEQLANRLNAAPFLWGPARSAVTGVAEALDASSGAKDSAPRESRLIRWLAGSDDAMINGLVVGAIADQWTRSPSGPAANLVRQLLDEHKGANRLAAKTAAQIALIVRDEPLLQTAVSHPLEIVRATVVEQADELWNVDPELTSRLLTYLLKNSSLKNITNPSNLSRSLVTAINMSLLVLLRELADNRQEASHALRRESSALNSVQTLQQIWRPIIKDYMFVSENRLFNKIGRKVRTTVVSQIASNVIIRRIKAIDKREYFTYSFEDIELFIPTRDDIRREMEAIVDGMEEASTSPTRSIQRLTDQIYQLAERGTKDRAYNNWVLAISSLIAVVAHFRQDRNATLDAVSRLLDRLEALYPTPTTDLSAPTASIWYLMMTYPYLSIPYLDLPKPEAERLLKRFMDVSSTAELRYRNIWSKQSPRALRLSNVEQYLFGYALELPEFGRDMLLEMARANVELDDRDHLSWVPYSIAIGLKRYGVPTSSGIAAFDDYISFLLEVGYFDRLSTKETDRFWEKASDDLVLYAGRHLPEFRALAQRLRKRQIPRVVSAALHEFENRLSTSVRRQGAPVDADAGADTQMSEALAWAMRNALFDRNPFFRDLLKKFLRHVTVAESTEAAINVLIQHVVEQVYGEKLF
jgi:hypothetical protein